MPVEEVTETEVVEKTTTEEIIICDGCAINTNSEDINVHSFYSKELGEDLFFCEECLDLEKKNPISERINNRIPPTLLRSNILTNNRRIPN